MPPAPGCPRTGPPSPEVTGAICRVPSASFSQAPWYTLPVHLCRFRVRSHVEAISWNAFAASPNPIRTDNTRHSSPSTGWGILTPFPSTTAFALALGPDLPREDQLYSGNLRYSAEKILTSLSLLIPAFSLLNSPLLLTVQLRPS